MSGDGLTFTKRNLIILVLTLVFFGALYGVYFELSPQTRDEPVYLSLFIISTILIVVFFGVVIHDSFTQRDTKMQKESDEARWREMKEINDRFPRGAGEYPAEMIGKDKKYHHNAFEKRGNIWRTLLFFVISLFSYISFMITYFRHSKSKRESPGYLVAVILATLAFLGHLGVLIYQLVEFFRIDRTPSIESIQKLQKRKMETRL